MTQPAGWYTDPQDARQLRFWNGTAWTAQTAPQQYSPPPQQYPPAPQQYPAAPYYPPAPGQYPPAPSQFGAPLGQRTLLQANRYAAITVGVSAIYVALAIATGIAFLGIVPVLFAARSFRARERFAVVAAAAAAVAVIAAVVTLAR